MLLSFLDSRTRLTSSETHPSFLTVDPTYTLDYGLKPLSSSAQPIDVTRVLYTGTVLIRPYNNEELRLIAADLFGVTRSVIKKGELVRQFLHPKQVAVIERDNHLKTLVPVKVAKTQTTRQVAEPDLPKVTAPRGRGRKPAEPAPPAKTMVRATRQVAKPATLRNPRANK